MARSQGEQDEPLPDVTGEIRQEGRAETKRRQQRAPRGLLHLPAHHRQGEKRQDRHAVEEEGNPGEHRGKGEREHQRMQQRDAVQVLELVLFATGDVQRKRIDHERAVAGVDRIETEKQKTEGAVAGRRQGAGEDKRGEEVSATDRRLIEQRPSGLTFAHFREKRDHSLRDAAAVADLRFAHPTILLAGAKTVARKAGRLPGTGGGLLLGCKIAAEIEVNIRHVLHILTGVLRRHGRGGIAARPTPSDSCETVEDEDDLLRLTGVRGDKLRELGGIGGGGVARGRAIARQQLRLAGDNEDAGRSSRSGLRRRHGSHPCETRDPQNIPRWRAR